MVDHNDSDAKELPSVSVIIPSFADVRRLVHCLGELYGHDYTGPVEILVVDNGNNLGLSELIRRYPRVTVIQEKIAGSYSARNAGVAASSGAILAFTDADCIPALGWISAGVAAVQNNGGIVGGRIEMFHEAGRTISLAELYDACTCFPQQVSISLRNYSVTANLFVSRQDFVKAGRFNNSLRSGGDREFCERAVRQGIPICYAPQAVVRHPARDTHAAIVQRVWRVEGGLRDIDPSWWGCAREIAKCLLPPFLELHPMLGERKAMSSLGQKIMVFWYAWWIRVLRAHVRLKLQLHRSESARS